MSKCEQGFSKDLQEEAKRLTEICGCFGIKIRSLIGICPGPRVTRYEFSVEPQTKMHRIKRLRDDISLMLSVSPIRMICPASTESSFAIEIPNGSDEKVNFEDAFASSECESCTDPLPALLGTDLLGEGVCMSLSKAPHVLIGGKTGSGKTTLLHNILLSLMRTQKPSQVKFLLISAQKRELSAYEKTNFLWEPVLGMDEDVLGALKQLEEECTWRYEQMKQHSVRNVDRLNLVSKEQLPRIVAILDEFAYLPTKKMRELESLVCRLAPIGRAAGIHLILSTAVLNSKTVTGLIKANLITRIALSVEKRAESLTVIDQGDAEVLLPYGDLLYCDSTLTGPQRINVSYLNCEAVEEKLSLQGLLQQ